MTAGLEARFELTRGTLKVDVELRAERGSIVALLGPNGAGKSTVVRALAGLVEIVTGHIAIEDVTLADTAAGVSLAAHQRPLTVMFQDSLLFPHMSAVDNVAYGLVSAGGGRAESREAALAMMRRFDVAAVAGLRPAQLSGGQAQRVALARALAPRPRLLLLDEPLGALDSRTRSAARSQLRELLADFDGTALVVTHDPVDALTLADTLAVMEEGRVVQQGGTDEIAARPRSRYVADFVGVNLFHGTAARGSVAVDGHPVAVASDLEGDVFAVLHPNAVALHRERPAGSARNVWRLRVEGVETSGDRARVRLGGEVPLVAEVTPAAVGELGLVSGTEVWAEVKATAFSVYSA